jgi:hypothetical protein
MGSPDLEFKFDRLSGVYVLKEVNSDAPTLARRVALPLTFVFLEAT